MLHVTRFMTSIWKVILFRSGRKKNIRATATQEFARSISVPGDRVIAAEKSRRQAISDDGYVIPHIYPSSEKIVMQLVDFDEEKLHNMTD
jgi:hypothetical protein